MIVSVDELKAVLGIDPADTAEDANLERLILAATAFVHSETKRYFDTPIGTTEYIAGTDTRTLYLSGYVDDSPAADNPSESLDPSTSVRVWSRSLYDTRPWELLIEGVDWERRGTTLIRRGSFGRWWAGEEYRIEYWNGYASAPEDIKAVVLELAGAQYAADSASASGTAGVTSEKIGDYSYTVDLGAVASIATTGGLSTQSMRTLNNYKRLLV